MAVWAIGDLHLSFGVPNKSMGIFGKKWENHAEKIRDHWINCVTSEDLVLLPGDISWAIHLEDAAVDLKWIDALPGTKVMIRGNHDYWWSSLSKIEKTLPPSIHLIQNNTFHWKGIEVAGARLWDTPEYRFDSYIEYIEREKPAKEKAEHRPEDDEKIFQRELQRLEMSLKCFNPQTKVRVAMTHYPPISADLKPSRASELLSRYGVNLCVFGHLHNVRDQSLPFGEKDHTRYILTSCDYLDFKPLKVLDI